MAGDWSFLSPEVAAVSVAFAVGAKLLYNMYNGSSNAGKEQNYVPYAQQDCDAEDVLAVDCTHPTAVTISHHRGNRNPAGLKPSDTSTGLVLNALHSRYGWNRDITAALSKPCITTNHFDIDSFLSVWCLLNPSLALQHETVLRHMARIGDFREAFLSPDLITAHGGDDNITFIREAYTALKLVCWLNTLESRLFSAPYETKDCDAKMGWFLSRFVLVLKDPESVWGDWQQEYTKVVSGFDLLSGGDCLVEVFPGVGLAVLCAPEPLHYYSLFSHTIGCDVVLTMYDDQRYEVECKYHQFVITTSHPVWPRLDMAPLAALLNQLEEGEGQQREQQQGQQQQRLVWMASRFTDTGPLLRLELPGQRLTKAQRYGHPCDRPIHSSSIPPSKMQAIVQSFLEFGLQGLSPRVGGYDWRELHALNDSIAWRDWSSCLLEQHARGSLDAGDRFLTERASKRRSSVQVTPPVTPAPGTPGSITPTHTAYLAPPSPRRVLSPPTRPPPPAAGGHTEVPGAQLGVQVPGTAMPAVGPVPQLVEVGHLLTPSHAQALAGVLPPLYRASDWSLLYSTFRDGISLHTLLRKAAAAAPTLLVVRDGSGAVFGAYAAEPWRVATRFFGTGEAFVFQLEPRRLMWPWLQLSAPGAPRNDFFQYATQECLAVGGAGHWALYLDEELAGGSSGPCDTFGSPCLAGSGDFEVVGVELWHVHAHVVHG